jgi:hypothetical protein
MDFHINIQDQTDCEEYTSKDIKDYLVEQFSNADKKIDFLFEIHPTMIKRFKTPFKLGYIREVAKLFSKAFKLQNDKVVSPTRMNNVRLHYIDPRDYFQGESISEFDAAYDIIYNMWSRITLNKNDIASLKQIYNKVKHNIQFLYNTLIDDIKVKKMKPYITTLENNELTDEERKTNTKSLIYKIRNRYNNKNIKKKINKIIKSDILSRIKKYNNMHKKNMKLLNDIEGSIIPNYIMNNHPEDPNYGMRFDHRITMLYLIYKNYNYLINLYMDINVLMMDVYFLRRFLDKDYITNAVVYTGAHHSLNYIYYLMKDFNFKLVNYSHLNKKSIDLFNFLLRCE